MTFLVYTHPNCERPSTDCPRYVCESHHDQLRRTSLISLRLVSVPPKHKIIDQGLTSSLMHDPPRPESSLNAEFEARWRKPSSHIRAARDRITQTPRNGRSSLTSDQNHGPRTAVAPTISSAATRPVRRTAAEKARRDDWIF
jgi:hypothetical protein